MTLLNLQKAIYLSIKEISPKNSVNLKLEECLNRILSENLISKKNSPPHDVSAMDGYAIDIKSLDGISTPLKVVGVIAAGKKYVKTVKIGEAVRIFTGSEMPKGANTVVIQENVKKQDNTIIIENTPRKFQNIRKKGFDFRTNSILLKKGTRLTPKHIALSAAMNYRKLSVIERPSVAIISTGSELVQPGSLEAKNNIICSSNYGIKTC
jgi:molybdopterin molybdotransferase